MKLDKKQIQAIFLFEFKNSWDNSQHQQHIWLRNC